MAQLVEQPIRNQQVKGSSPFIGSIFRGVAQFGSAFGSGPKGRRFKSCHLDQKTAGNLRISGSFFVSFAQSAVFGAFFMQRMCNLGKRAKDTVPYRSVDLADSWSPEPKGRSSIVCEHTLLICIVRAIIYARIWLCVKCRGEKRKITKFSCGNERSSGIQRKSF